MPLHRTVLKQKLRGRFVLPEIKSTIGRKMLDITVQNFYNRENRPIVYFGGGL